MSTFVFLELRRISKVREYSAALGEKLFMYSGAAIQLGGVFGTLASLTLVASGALAQHSKPEIA